jgi:hypothetical protein
LKPVPAEDVEKDLNFMGIFEGAIPYLRTQNNQSNQKAEDGDLFCVQRQYKLHLSDRSTMLGPYSLPHHEKTK